MSKLSHSNPFLDDVLHEGNKHEALGGPHFGEKVPHILFNTSKPNKIDLGPRGEAAQDAFDSSFDEWCSEGNDYD